MTTPMLYVGTADGLHILRGDSERRRWSPAHRALAGHDMSALGWDMRAPHRLLAGTAAGAPSIPRSRPP